MQIEKLKKGATYSVKGKNYKVVEEYRIDWQDGTTSHEYGLRAKDKTERFLELYIEGQVKKYSLWTMQTYPKDLLKVGELAEKIDFEGKSYPKKINYKSTTYQFDEACKGIYDDENDKEDMYAITYSNSLKSKSLSIEFYEDETEMSIGEPLNASNIHLAKHIEKSFTDSGIFQFIKKNLIVIGLIILFPFFLLAETCNKGKKTDRKTNSTYRNRSTGGFGK